MINVRKGTAHSLAQTDFIGAAYTGEGVVAGMLVQKDTSGNVRIITSASNFDTAHDVGQVGFAVTNQDEGDAIESGKIGVYGLDGDSVLETDQFTGTYTVADIGKSVVFDGTAAGQVKAVAHGAVGTARVLGTVYDAPRNIFVGFSPIEVLPIKLSSGQTVLS
jgi:hypothetical protein